MKKYKYILLDWDGNLAKTLDIWLDAARTVLENRGIIVSDEEITTSFGSFHSMWQEWGVIDIEVALEEIDSLVKKGLPDVELYPNVLEVLESLKDRGKKLALVTTSRHKYVQLLLDKFNLSSLFEAVIGGDDVLNHKPHPEPLEKALLALGGNTEESIMIGDSDKDIGAANNLGIDSILFHSPEHKKYYDIKQLKELKPTYIIEDFRKVLDIV